MICDYTKRCNFSKFRLAGQGGKVPGGPSKVCRSEPFEACACIDRGLRQGFEMRLEAIALDVAQVADAIELHEHQVPDFDVAAAFAAEFAVGVTLIRGCGAHVVVNFAAWAARAGIAHGPEV